MSWTQVERKALEVQGLQSLPWLFVIISQCCLMAPFESKWSTVVNTERAPLPGSSAHTDAAGWWKKWEEQIKGSYKAALHGLDVEEKGGGVQRAIISYIFITIWNQHHHQKSISLSEINVVGKKKGEKASNLLFFVLNPTRIQTGRIYLFFPQLMFKKKRERFIGLTL